MKDGCKEPPNKWNLFWRMSEGGVGFCSISYKKF